MKYFTYGRMFVDGVYYNPDPFLWNCQFTSSIFYNANWFCKADIESLSAVPELDYFDPTEITEEYFNEAFVAQPVPPPSGSI
jgi:hypothetical protein